MFKLLWMAFCTLVGAAIGAALGWTKLERTGLIAGAILGAGLGLLFGRFIGISDVLA